MNEPCVSRCFVVRFFFFFFQDLILASKLKCVRMCPSSILDWFVAIPYYWWPNDETWSSAYRGTMREEWTPGESLTAACFGGALELESLSPFRGTGEQNEWTGRGEGICEKGCEMVSTPFYHDIISVNQIERWECVFLCERTLNESEMGGDLWGNLIPNWRTLMYTVLLLLWSHINQERARTGTGGTFGRSRNGRIECWDRWSGLDRNGLWLSDLIGLHILIVTTCV